MMQVNQISSFSLAPFADASWSCNSVARARDGVRRCACQVCMLVERKSGGFQPTQAYANRLEGRCESLVFGSFRFL